MIRRIMVKLREM
jgi:hypothetical protein